jgi:SAM-dependent methyltransferase
VASTPTDLGSGSADGSAGDADYGTIGEQYSRYRRADPRIASRIVAALGGARSVLNVGAGAGSYEPTDREVTAVEPSASMRAQRSPTRPIAIDARAESLPFADKSFDAVMTTFSVHQWADLAAGLSELRRVSRGPVVILTCDPDELDRFWLGGYAPGVIAAEARRYPAMSRLVEALGPDTRVSSVPIPLDCTDGFGEAYYGRPEAFLDPAARRANSAWSFVDAATADRYVAALAADLDSGEWDRRFAALRSQPEFDGSLRLVVG